MPKTVIGTGWRARVAGLAGRALQGARDCRRAQQQASTSGYPSLQRGAYVCVASAEAAARGVTNTPSASMSMGPKVAYRPGFASPPGVDTPS